MSMPNPIAGLGARVRSVLTGSASPEMLAVLADDDKAAETPDPSEEEDEAEGGQPETKPKEGEEEEENGEEDDEEEEADPGNAPAPAAASDEELRQAAAVGEAAAKKRVAAVQAHADVKGKEAAALRLLATTDMTSAQIIATLPDMKGASDDMLANRRGKNPQLGAGGEQKPDADASAKVWSKANARVPRGKAKE